MPFIIMTEHIHKKEADKDPCQAAKDSTHQPVEGCKRPRKKTLIIDTLHKTLSITSKSPSSSPKNSPYNSPKASPKASPFSTPKSSPKPSPKNSSNRKSPPKNTFDNAGENIPSCVCGLELTETIIYCMNCNTQKYCSKNCRNSDLTNHKMYCSK